MPAPANRYPHESFTKTTVYIIDDRDPLANERSGRLASRLGKGKSYDEHSRKCEQISDWFGMITDYEVKSVKFPAKSKPAQFFAYWDSELKNVSAGHLIIIYYHGKAGGNGEDYTWKFDGSYGLQIDAYAFISKIKATDADCLMILDCFVPTRFQDKWSQKNGNVEIIAGGAAMQDHLGRREIDHNSDFTKAFAFNTLSFVDEIDGRFKRSQAPRSIPELMAHDKEMASNPLRLWLDKTTDGGEDTVKRIKIIPQKVRESKKIEFFSFTIQTGTKKVLGITEGDKTVVPSGEMEEEDEGIFIDETFSSTDDDEH